MNNAYNDELPVRSFRLRKGYILIYVILMFLVPYSTRSSDDKDFDYPNCSPYSGTLLPKGQDEGMTGYYIKSTSSAKYKNRKLTITFNIKNQSKVEYYFPLNYWDIGIVANDTVKKRLTIPIQCVQYHTLGIVSEKLGDNDSNFKYMADVIAYDKKDTIGKRVAFCSDMDLVRLPVNEAVKIIVNIPIELNIDKQARKFLQVGCRIHQKITVLDSNCLHDSTLEHLNIISNSNKIDFTLEPIKLNNCEYHALTEWHSKPCKSEYLNEGIPTPRRYRTKYLPLPNIHTKF